MRSWCWPIGTLTRTGVVPRIGYFRFQPSVDRLSSGLSNLPPYLGCTAIQPQSRGVSSTFTVPVSVTVTVFGSTAYGQLVRVGIEALTLYFPGASVSVV